MSWLHKKKSIAITTASLLLLAIVLFTWQPWKNPSTPIEAGVAIEAGGFKDGIHLASGLKQGEGLELVLGNCTNCHSAKLIIQNRATRDGWKNMIRWMQETQKLWDLGDQEAKILDYLEANYAPEYKGRRQPLTEIEWYTLDEGN